MAQAALAARSVAGRGRHLGPLKRRLLSSGPPPAKNFFFHLRDRGLVERIFPSEKDADARLSAHLLAQGPRAAYAGFDPTAPSLHVGNLLVLVALLHAQRGGHRAVALLGGATARVGDPSGKTEERPLLTKEVSERNLLGLRKNIEAVFRNHEEFLCDGTRVKREKLIPVEVVNNSDWYQNISVVDFFCSTARKLRVGDILARSAVRDRLASEQGMSYAEFSYQAFQAFDWLHLLQNEDCSIQIGGSDQFGNIHTGRDLIKRVEGSNREVYGLFVPLMTSAGGDKLGKTAAGSPLWLSPDMTAPFDFYQYFLRQPDSGVEKLLKALTFLPMAEIQDVIDVHDRDRGKRHGQRVVAEQVTLLVHGKEGLQQARQTTDLLFGDRPVETLTTMTPSALREVFSQAAYRRLLYRPDLSLRELAMQAGCFKSENKACEIIEAGGFYVNQERRRNADEIVLPGSHILQNNVSLLRVGKKSYYVIEWTM